MRIVVDPEGAQRAGSMGRLLRQLVKQLVKQLLSRL
jgi:hypothetical protein